MSHSCRVFLVARTRSGGACVTSPANHCGARLTRRKRPGTRSWVWFRTLARSTGTGAPAFIIPHRRIAPVISLCVSGDPSTFVPVLRSVATTVDPTLRLYSVMPMSAVANSEIEFYRFWFRLTLGVSGVALLLSLAGIYAVLAFTVSRRTREIGIRVALGSDSRRTVAAIFRRPLLQVVGGVAVGALFVALLFTLGRGALPTALQFARIGAYGVGMTLVCFLACIVPTRRALRIEPTEALRMEG